ncbi:MAG: hypothetical protein RL699_1171 [Bacteroidota bacterium]|jgi:hypothetical protein
MKHIFLFSLCIWASTSWSQTVTVLEVNDTLQQPKYQQFIYLSPTTAVNQAVFVAKIKASGSLKNISDLFDKIKGKAQAYGANAFQFVAFTAQDPTVGELTLNTYYADDTLLDTNFETLPKNKLVVFGSDNFLETKVQSYKVQGQKQEIASGQYQVYDLSLQDELRLNKGGFTGMTLFLSKQTEGYCYFLNFGGIGLAGAAVNPYGGVGVSITTGSISHVEPNLALLLMQFFTEKPNQ